uniref:Uncharacterized protein n=1 Tax=Anguilla anguilla TaxID=7936 RepID=A0A0E9TH01_ANGAN
MSSENVRCLCAHCHFIKAC